MIAKVALATGDRVNRGDKLDLRVTTSTPGYDYVANQDEEGDGVLLYALHADAGGSLEVREHHLLVEENGSLWQVTKPGRARAPARVRQQDAAA